MEIGADPERQNGHAALQWTAFAVLYGVHGNRRLQESAFRTKAAQPRCGQSLFLIKRKCA